MPGQWAPQAARRPPNERPSRTQGVDEQAEIDGLADDAVGTAADEHASRLDRDQPEARVSTKTGQIGKAPPAANRGRPGLQKLEEGERLIRQTAPLLDA